MYNIDLMYIGGKMNNLHITSLKTYQDWIGRIKSENPDAKFIYRGQCDSAYGLETGASRRLRKEYLSVKDTFVSYHEKLIESARAKIKDDYKKTNSIPKLELLAELQHYGAATGLLDFSLNPLVALWFACQSREPIVEGKIFAINKKNPKIKPFESIKDYESFGDYFGNIDIWYWKPDNFNKRIESQRSVFLFGPPDLNGLLDNEVDSEIIVRFNKKYILEELKDAVNKDESSIYPDFYGFADLNRNYRQIEFIHNPYREGLLLLEKDNVEKALKCFAQLSIVYPSINLHIISILLKKEMSVSKFIGEIDRLISQKQERNKAYINVLKEFLREKNYKKFDEFTKMILDRESNNIEILRYKYLSLLMRGDTCNSQKMLNKNPFLYNEIINDLFKFNGLM